MKQNLFFFFFFFYVLFICTLLQLSHQQQQQQEKLITSFSIKNSPWKPQDNRLLVSANATFAAGFRQLSSGMFTFSTWYYNISRNTTNQVVTWSANANSSIIQVDRSATISITSTGELRLGSSGRNIWSKPSGNMNSSELSFQENGNLVFGNWKSFDSPTDTVLQGQNLTGIQLASENKKFSFRKSKELVFNSSDGYYTAENAFTEFSADGSITQDNGQKKVSADIGESRMRRLALDNDGNLRIYSFYPEHDHWVVRWEAVNEPCKIKGTCGLNSICLNERSNSRPVCVCPPGFLSVSLGNQECRRNISIGNMNRTKFIPLDFVSFEGSANSTVQIDVANFAMCESKCLAKANCSGFAFKYDGKGFCALLDQLVNGYWSPGTEMVTYLRVDESESNPTNFTGMRTVLETTCPVRIALPPAPEESSTTTRNIVIITTIFAAELIFGALFFKAFLKRYVKYRDMASTLGLEFLPTGGPKRFSLTELKAATGEFSNLIGRGGFGEVYKGVLQDGRVVAVKRLREATGGDAEFWAEVTIIARRHHLNLVRLWGFCAEKGQKILVYEYVPNGSLDKFLFSMDRYETSSDDDNMSLISRDGRKPVLDWGIRYRIALGVARAIAYLHEECLEWVLHCDIKPENILLGDDFCPKISDFGLAKLKKKEDMVTMSRTRGTRGYMAPEWLNSDPITSKADVYSFGMVLLEMVSGVRNFVMQESTAASEDWYFPRWAFDKVFKELNVEDILDGRIKRSYDNRAHFDMVDRMVKTAFWCLQDRPEMRPSMGKVAKMLEGSVEITEPPKPTIFYLADG